MGIRTASVNVVSEMPISDYIGWPRARNGIGDGKVLVGEGEKPPTAQWIQDCLAGTSAQPASLNTARLNCREANS